MFFRNLTLFRFPVSHNLDALETGVAECALKPVGPLEFSSRGFVSPFGIDSDALLHRIGSAIWLTIGGEDRLLPGAVVNSELAKMLAKLEQSQGRKPGAIMRRRIKDELIVDLLPRAFLKPVRFDVLIDVGLGLVAVNTASRKAAENAVSEIRRALGSFPALPLNAEIAPRSILTGWVAGEELPDGLSLGEECELRDPVDDGAKARFTGQELQGAELAEHLEAGKQVTRVALTLDDHVSFVVGEDLVLRKFRMLDGALDSLDSMEHEDLRAELDARFALFSGEVRRVFEVLAPALKLSKVEG